MNQRDRCGWWHEMMSRIVTRRKCPSHASLKGSFPRISLIARDRSKFTTMLRTVDLKVGDAIRPAECCAPIQTIWPYKHSRGWCGLYLFYFRIPRNLPLRFQNSRALMVGSREEHDSLQTKTKRVDHNVGRKRFSGVEHSGQQRPEQ